MFNRSLKMLKYLPILKLFEKQKEITRSDVEEALGAGTTHAVNLINEMQAKDLLVFTEYKYLKDVVGDEYKFYMNEDCDVVYYKLGQ